MTGYTSGPHVCYRFWKNGKQVDPFKTKLPDAKPIASELKDAYLQHMIPWKDKLDCIYFEEQKQIPMPLPTINPTTTAAWKKLQKHCKETQGVSLQNLLRMTPNGESSFTLVGKIFMSIFPKIT
ncbi:MAG: hypothetical protein CM15mP83_0160 [Flavobacteriaceae bacterium]|nr:MAG: hypothetical protein CM15mP83_0160 [Flavobacteriaceae bacterium]